MVSNSVEESHEMAAKIGVGRGSFRHSDKLRIPYYILTQKERTRAIEAGAQPCANSDISFKDFTVARKRARVIKG